MIYILEFMVYYELEPVEIVDVYNIHNRLFFRLFCKYCLLNIKQRDIIKK